MERENRFAWTPGDLVKIDGDNPNAQKLEAAIQKLLAESDLVDEERIKRIVSHGIDLLDLYSYQPYDRTENMILSSVKTLFLRKF